MGPIRRRLTLASFGASLLPHAAWADACGTIRPNWDGTPVTALQEALFLFATPASLVLVLASLLAMRFRHHWAALGVVLGWTLVVSLVTMADPTGLNAPAAAQGCVGSPTLFIVLVAAICGVMIIFTAPGSPRPDEPKGEK